LQLAVGLSIDILMLNIVGVIVVSAVEVMAEILVLQGVGVSWMTMSPRLKLVKFVGHVRRIAYDSGQVEECQCVWR
jgi:hypothetical protein